MAVANKNLPRLKSIIPQSSSRPRSPWNIAESVAVFLALLCVLLPIALSRLIARDEGFYLLAARLVMEKELPYVDFFYPQMPLFPYLYGLWMKIFSFSWTSGRTFSAWHMDKLSATPTRIEACRRLWTKKETLTCRCGSVR
jgi:O-antigen ligase